MLIGQRFTAAKNAIWSYVLPRFRRILNFFRIHHPARMFYGFLVFIGLNIFASVIQAFIQSGGFPGIKYIERTYLVQLALHHPYIFWPLATVSICFAFFGWRLDRREKLKRKEEEGQQLGRAAGQALVPFVRALTQELNQGIQRADIPEWTPPRDISVLPLPPRASGLVGRAEEQQWLRDRLLEGKMTGIWAFAGMGGVGKTSLVADLLPRIADEFSGGVGVIRANEITDPIIVLRQLVEKFVPNGPELLERGALTKAALRSRFSSALTDLQMNGRRVLIAIDNVEPPLIPKLKPLLDLLQVTRVSVVITAREELDSRLVDESLEINVLSDDMAAELLERLLYGKNREIPVQEHEDILTICKIVGNHAQALVLAAADKAQRSHMSIHEYRQHLEIAPDAILNLFDQLSADAPSGVRLTFASSYDHLKKSAQQLFVALGTLAGPSCTVDAVLALGNTPERTHETQTSLDALLNAKLVRKSAVSINNPQNVQRIELHPLVQQFARELLDQQSASKVQKIRGTLARHYGLWVEGKTEDVLSYDDLNLIAALEWARDHRPQTNLVLAQLTYYLGEYWKRRHQLELSTMWLPLGIEAMSRLESPWNQRRAELTHLLAAIYYSGGRTAVAKGYYLQSLELFRQAVDRKGESLALRSLGVLSMHTGDPESSKDYLTRSLEIRQQIADRKGEGQSLSSLGFLALDIDPPSAKDYFLRSLSIFRELGERREEAISLRALGTCTRSMGDIEAAWQFYAESLAVFRKIPYRRDEAITLQYLGLLLRDSDPAASREYYNDSLDILNEIDDWKNKIASLYGLGFVHLNLNELDTAERYFSESLELCRQLSDQRSEGITLRGLGLFAEKQGAIDQAEHYYRDGLAIAMKVSHAENIAWCSEALGKFLLKYRGQEGKSEGCQKLAEAAKMYQQVNLPKDFARIEQEILCFGCSGEHTLS